MCVCLWVHKQAFLVAERKIHPKLNCFASKQRSISLPAGEIGDLGTCSASKQKFRPALDASAGKKGGGSSRSEGLFWDRRLGHSV